MPISQINPDGTVKIVNSKTGAVADVKPEELANYNPKLVVDYQEKLQEYQTKQAAINLYKSGQAQLTQEEAIKNPLLAQEAVKAGVKIKTQGDQKKDDSLSATVNLLNTLERHYDGAGGGSFGIGPMAGIRGFAREMEGKLGLNDSASTYTDERAGFAATLKSLTGDTGVLTDADYDRLSKLLPGIGATSGVAKNKFRDLRSQISAKYGGKITDTTYLTPEEKQKKNGKQTLAPQVQSPVPQGQMQASMGPSLPEQDGKSTTQNASSFLRKIGLGALPDAGAAVTGAVSGGIGDNNPFITREEMEKVKQEGQLNTAKNAAGIASYAPLFSALKAAPAVKFLTQNSASGALGAASQQGFDPAKMAQGAVGANIVGGLLKVPRAVTSGIAKTAPGFVNQLFKPNNSAVKEFTRNTGLDFAEEVMKRDLPAIKGKAAPEVLDYFKSKLSSVNNAADDFLDKNAGEIDKSDIIAILDKHAAKLTPANGRVLQGEGKAALEKLAEEVHLMPDKLKGSIVNQIKRDAQTAGQSAFGPSGSSSPTSNAFAEAQREIGNLLESKAPGVKELNKTIQYYRLARDSMTDRVTQASKSEGGLITQLLTNGAGAGAIYGAATMNPGIAAAAAAPALINALYRNSRFKTMAADTARKVPQAQDNEILRRILAPAAGREASNY